MEEGNYINNVERRFVQFRGELGSHANGVRKIMERQTLEKWDPRGLCIREKGAWTHS